MSKVSLKAKIYNYLVKVVNVKKRLQTQKGVDGRLQQSKIANSSKYLLPKKPYTKEFKELQIEGLQCFTLQGNKDAATILFFHGGAFTDMPNKRHFEFVNRLNRKLMCNIIVPIYPKLPQCNAEQSYQILFKFYNNCVEKYGSNIILMGDSAGGAICATLNNMASQNKIALPMANVLYCPWVDVDMDNEKSKTNENKDTMLAHFGLQRIGELWKGKTKKCEELANVKNQKISKFAKTLIVVGEYDLLYFDIIEYYNNLKASNVDVQILRQPQLGHDYILFNTKESALADDTVKEFLKIN